MKSEALTIASNKAVYAPALLVGIVIYFSEDTILFGTNSDVGLSTLKYMIYLVVTLVLLIKINRNILRSHGIYILGVIFVSIISTSLFHLDFSGGYAYQAYIAFLALLVAQAIDFRTFADLFRKYMFVLCLLSIVIFTVSNLFDWVLDYFPTSENTAGIVSTNLFVGSVYMDVAETRNLGIFREPGVFVIYILFAITIEFFYRNKVSITVLVCLIATLFTTYSTTAFFTLFVLIVGYFFKGGRKNSHSDRVIILAITILIVSIFVFQPDTYDQIFSKLNSDSASFESGVARVASIVVNWEIFTSSPFVGSGLANYGALFTQFSRQYFGVPLEAGGQSTNSFMSLFGTYGLVYGLVVIYAVLRLTKNFTRSFIVQGSIFLAFCLMFSSQDLRYSLLFYMLIFYGLNYAQNKPCRSSLQTSKSQHGK